MTDELNANEGLTRREALKKGARLGGALVWAVPVVQTVGMSPAMAQTVSEGNCCLRVEIVSVQVIANDSDGVADDIEVKFRGLNCGSGQIFDVGLRLKRSRNGGPFGNAVNVQTSSNPLSGQKTDTETVIVNPGSGSYEFRLSGTKKCTNPDLGPADIFDHDVPTPYDFAGPVVIPRPLS